MSSVATDVGQRTAYSTPCCAISGCVWEEIRLSITWVSKKSGLRYLGLKQEKNSYMSVVNHFIIIACC